MKDYKRLGATAHLTNDNRGLVNLTFDDFDGGDFDLQPLIDDDSIYLPDPFAARYALRISANNPDVLKRVGNAFLTLARKKAGETDSTDAPDSL